MTTVIGRGWCEGDGVGFGEVGGGGVDGVGVGIVGVGIDGEVGGGGVDGVFRSKGRVVGVRG